MTLKTQTKPSFPYTFSLSNKGKKSFRNCKNKEEHI